MRSEISHANAERVTASCNLAKASRGVVRRGIDEKWWPSLILYLNLHARCTVNNQISRHIKSSRKTQKAGWTIKKFE